LKGERKEKMILESPLLALDLKRDLLKYLAN